MTACSAKATQLGASGADLLDMPALAALTALPIAAAFIVCVGLFIVMTAVMVHTQRQTEGRESPFDAFWHRRDNARTSEAREHSRNARETARWTRPTIHFVTYRRDASAYELPNEYDLVGVTR